MLGIEPIQSEIDYDHHDSQPHQAKQKDLENGKVLKFHFFKGIGENLHGTPK